MTLTVKRRKEGVKKSLRNRRVDRWAEISPTQSFFRSAQNIWRSQMVWVDDYDGLDSFRIWSPGFRDAATQPEVKLPETEIASMPGC